MSKEAASDILPSRLLQMRSKRKLSQKELGDLAGFDKHTISKYERGHLTPSLDTLALLCESMKCSSDFLLGIRNDGMALEALNDPALREILSVAQSVAPERRGALLEILKSVTRNITT
ncbi:MAG: helix-turn-helix transcriptional regulator [Cytophagales bacterium]|nr:helix-turn-helix transcriptional regulator [Cytophagales bacterium]